MVVVGLSWSVRGGAQPSVDDVYADAKDVIGELIERDVAENIAPNLGCYSPGGILKYFPETLQAIYERNFGAIKDALRREVVALVANHSFESFRQRRSIPLAEFIPIVAFDPTQKSTCKEKIVAAGGPAPYQEELGRERKRLNGERYFPLDTCSNPMGPPEELELACFFAQSVMASMSGRAVDAQELLSSAAGFTTSIVLASYSPMTKATLRRAVTDEIRARFATGAFLPDGLVAALATTDLQEALQKVQTLFEEAMEKIQKLNEPARQAALPLELGKVLPLEDVFALPSPSLRIRVGALRLWIAPADPPIVTVTDSQGSLGEQKPVPKLLSNLAGLARELPSPGDPPGAAIARALLVQSSEVPRGAVTVSDTDKGVEIKFEPSDKSPANFTGPGLQRLQELHEMARMAAQFDRLLGKTVGDDASKIAIVKGVMGLIQALDNLVAKLKSAAKTDGSGVDLLALLDGVVRDCASAPAVPAGDGVVPVPAKQSPDSAEQPVMVLSLCDVWKQFTALLDPEGTLRPILTAARDRNYRALAINVVSAAFSPLATEQLCCGKSASCAQNVGLYGRLSKSFVSYVLMPRDDGDASLAARAAFKSAAVDVIRSAGQRGGFDRPAAGWWVPTMALRASWNAAYQEEDARATGVRIIPTVDWLSVRVPWSYNSSTFYVAATFSLVDLLAPFAEIVSRQSMATHYDHKTTGFLAGFFQPRISAMIAAPGFSKHTSLSVGGSLRGAVPFDLRRTDDGVKQFKYAHPLEEAGLRDLYETGDRLWRFVEVSAAVQYTP